MRQCNLLIYHHHLMLTIAQKHELSKLKAKYHATQVEDDSPTQLCTKF
jgi:hypothetical protein